MTWENLPSISPFFNEKFMTMPTFAAPITGRMLSFDKEKENNCVIKPEPATEPEKSGLMGASPNIVGRDGVF